MIDIQKLRLRVSGKEVFIVGSGASLIGFPFAKLKDKITICVNWTYKDVPDYDFVCALDFYFWDENKDIPDDKRMPRGFFMDNTDIYTANNSGFSAMSAAVYAGASAVYLLGMDGGGAHYYDKDDILPDTVLVDSFENFDRFKNQNIINLCQTSKITTFPKRDWKNFPPLMD